MPTNYSDNKVIVPNESGGFTVSRKGPQFNTTDSVPVSPALDLPDRLELPQREGSTYFRGLGWNECLDEIARRNAGLPAGDGYRTSADGMTRTKVAPDAAAAMVPSHSVTFHFGADGRARLPCSVCGKSYGDHGSYPTCASHPYTADGRCGHVGTYAGETFTGVPCAGAECRNGCAAAGGVTVVESLPSPAPLVAAIDARAVGVAVVQSPEPERTCRTCRHGDAAGLDAPCRNCSIGFGELASHRDRWEAPLGVTAPREGRGTAGEALQAIVEWAADGVLASHSETAGQ